jgi:hypothetical protein
MLAKPYAPRCDHRSNVNRRPAEPECTRVANDFIGYFLRK